MSDKTNKKISETAKREEEILAFWKDKNIFEKSLEKDAPEGEFVFYDGPPFATGLPHPGSLLSSVVKDVVGRYKTMRGYRVPRRWGWDCHGLPIENMIEKKLDLKTKKDIEELGIDKFNEEAKSTVLTYVDEWKEYVERIGRWVDFDNSYKTMDNTYMESVWWALKKIHDDGRLYEGKKVLMYCPRCETPLSKAEIAMDNSYKDVTDEAVFVKFKLKTGQKIGEFETDENTYILAWTTTPWTLPGNVALAVGEDVEYVVVKKEKEIFILAKERVESVLKDIDFDIIETVKGKDLVGLSYEPLYKIEKAEKLKSEKAWTVISADFVTTEDGTGVVHIAPMYGEDDYNLGLENDLPVVPILDATGIYNEDAPELVKGMYHKKGGRYITEDLEKRGLLFAKHKYEHSYPHCYRCGTALIYNALSSWFIDIQSVKERLLEANEEINWYPSHLKHGRFQNIVKTAPDWTISRNRFWASPLPIWKNDNDKVFVIGSLEELKEKTKKSGNKYIFIRHGEADSNVEHIISSLTGNEHHLTENGKEQIKEVAKKLKEEKITKIIASPLVRTYESAEMIADEIGYDKEKIEKEDRFMEWQLGDFNGKKVSELKNVCESYEDRFTKGCGTGETLSEMKSRIGEALYELEEKYENEVILVVGHEYTLWLAECVARGATVDECIEIRGEKDDFVKNAEIRNIDFVPLPHNKNYELDLHRPYIDDLKLVDEDGNKLTRIPEVVDCWVESGSMPFASEHYPHENKKLVKRRYPGDFIAEYIAQTRTWFYYMHALGVLLFNAPSFKNCVTTGTLLASDGSKISKSKNNFTDPRDNIDIYGADAMRFYMLSSVVMSAEDVAFKDEDLKEVHNRFINMFWNSYKFFKMNVDDVQKYNDKDFAGNNVLDKWILARLNNLISEMTKEMDGYDTVRTLRNAREFMSDFSQWYIRRSRSRFKSENKEDVKDAIVTTKKVLLTFSKLIAPFSPYIAESVYLGCAGEKESVHLDEWPKCSDDKHEDLISDMDEVRRISSIILEVRQREGIKVRQPLAKVTVSGEQLKGKEDLINVLLDEVNIKQMEFNDKQKDEIVVDTEITDELKLEGSVRDVIRFVQNIRKKNKLVQQDDVKLLIKTDDEGKKIIDNAKDELKRVAGVVSIDESNEASELLKTNGTEIAFSVVKVV